MTSSLLVRRALACLLGVALALPVALLLPEPASAAGARTQHAAPATVVERATPGRVRGSVAAPAAARSVLLTWFTADYRYLGKRTVRGGAYSLSLPAGSYRLQFTDTRPAYDIGKAAPVDVGVTVRSGRTTQRNVALRRGAAIVGTVRAGGKPAKKARLVAALPDERTFEVVANAAGQFALGGLPAGSYSLFTYDRAKRFTAKSSYFKNLKPGVVRNTTVKLATPAGRMLVDLYDADRRAFPTTYATAVNRRTGQFWVAKARGGSVTFDGLAPGGYRLVVNGAGDFLGQSGPVRGRVRPGKVTFTDFVMTRRGGSVTGAVKDAGKAERTPLKGAIVTLYGADGRELGRDTTGADGSYRIAGAYDGIRGARLVVRPDPDEGGGYLGVEPDRELFGQCTLDGISVTAGRVTNTGDLALPRGADARTACRG